MIVLVMTIWFFTLAKKMQNLLKASVSNGLIVLFLLSGCQSMKSQDGSNIDNSEQTQNFLNIGVPIEEYNKQRDFVIEIENELQKLEEQVEQIIRNGNLDVTEELLLEEIELEQKKGNNKRILELIQKLEKYRRIKENDSNKKLAEVLVLKGRVLFSQLQLKEAQKAIERAIELDSNNPEYLLILARYLRWNGKYQRTREVSEEAIILTKNQESKDRNNPDIENKKFLLAECLSILGQAYLLGGNYNLAISPLQQSLKIRKKLLGKEHSDVADSLNDLAILYHSQGRYSEAELLYQQAIEIDKKNLGESNTSVTTSLNNLANLYSDQGRYSEAEALYQQAIEINKKLLGEEHLLVATNLNNLANIHSNQGRYSEAETLSLQALELSKKLLGEEHPNVANNLNNLSKI